MYTYAIFPRKSHSSPMILLYALTRHEDSDSHTGWVQSSSPASDRLQHYLPVEAKGTTNRSRWHSMAWHRM